MSEHTPGPWRWRNRDTLVQTTDVMKRVLEFHLDPEGWMDGWIRCSNADRALIAAAPDLLAICEESARWLKACAGFFADDLGEIDAREIDAILKQSATAIAKAQP